MRLTAHTRIIGTLAVALIAAVLAPGASADYGVTHQQAARSLGTGANPRGVAVLAQQSGQSASSTRVVRPNPDQQGAQSGSVGPPILPVARAAELGAIHRAEAQREAARFYSLPQDARYSSAAFNAYATLARPVAASSPTVKASGDGFDYGAAAVGAGLALTIIVVVTAGGLAVRRRRRPQYG
ncbi:MAG TPA: hypothetical protein VN880_09225 [Solirubrobacteraceae bacterium]|jgi:hypothetical protein|nr:hypothetical protein [Solirubrobacteraceae bacterium]